MVLEEGSDGQTDILHEVQVTYQKKQSEDTLRIRDHQAASEEALFPLYFMKTDAVKTLIEKLLPLCTVVTPNIPEAEVLSGLKIETVEDMEKAAQTIHERYHCAVLVKGGHFINDANDLLCADGRMTWFHGTRIDNPNTHGTGCTLSSAIASCLARGFDLKESITHAKKYLSGALSSMLDLGKGAGPMDHGYTLAKGMNRN